MSDDKLTCDCANAAVRYFPDGAPEPCMRCQPAAYRAAWNAREQAQRQLKTEKLINGSGLAPRYRELSFDGFQIYDSHREQMAGILRVCKEYAENFEQTQRDGKWLIMLGGCGTGKGHLAAAIANMVMTRNLGTVIFRKYIELVSKIKETWHGKSDVAENEIIEAVRECDLLILDEIGMQFETNAERVILYRVLDSRYENVRPLIMTSNLSEKQLEKVIGERAIDRIYEPPNRILVFDWPSYRRRGC